MMMNERLNTDFDVYVAKKVLLASPIPKCSVRPCSDKGLCHNT